MAPISRKLTIILGLAIVVVVGYFAQLSNTSEAVPPDLLAARQEGSVIAQDIVNLSNRFSDDLERINELDREGQPAEALILATGMLQRIPEVKTRATDLSKELEKMTSALATIKSDEARAAAIESITNRMALIGRLFSYSEYMIQLSKVLQDRFREIPNNQSVAELTAQINAEVTAINNFNRAASEAMSRFDVATGAR